jgi:hypothetical protein
MLIRLFSQRTRVQQSISGSIMNAIIGYLHMQNMMQKGLRSFLGGGGGYTGDARGLKSALSGNGWTAHQSQSIESRDL